MGGKERKIDMKNIEVKIAKGQILAFAQLYGSKNSENDIFVNGAISFAKDLRELRKFRVFANLCNEQGEILHILSTYKAFSTINSYYSFSLYCADISRYLEVDKLAYVEVYAVLDDKCE